MKDEAKQSKYRTKCREVAFMAVQNWQKKMPVEKTGIFDFS